MRQTNGTRKTCCALMLLALGACAQTGPADKPAAPKAVADAPKPIEPVRAAPVAKRIDPMADVAGDKPLPPLKGAAERLDCATGAGDQHRIGLEARGGQITYFTYYNKWRLRTCSLEFTRDARGTKWRLTAEGDTRVQTPQGIMIIRSKNNAYEFEFQNVSRREFCATAGEINGAMNVTRGAVKRACTATGFANPRDE